MSMMTCDPASRSGRALRSDAERNRRLILSAARVVVAELGSDAGFNEVARRAGVGVGTVYRHFPDRRGLVDGLIGERIDEVVSLADQAATWDDSWSALWWFVESLIELQVADRGLRQAMADCRHVQEHRAAVYDRLLPTIEAVLRRAQTTGGVRQDVEASDLVALASMISSQSSAHAPERRRRCLAVLLDGLREKRATTTPLTVSFAHPHVDTGPAAPSSDGRAPGRCCNRE